MIEIQVVLLYIWLFKEEEKKTRDIIRQHTYVFKCECDLIFIYIVFIYALCWRPHMSSPLMI